MCIWSVFGGSRRAWQTAIHPDRCRKSNCASTDIAIVLEPGSVPSNLFAVVRHRPQLMPRTSAAFFLWENDDDRLPESSRRGGQLIPLSGDLNRQRRGAHFASRAAWSSPPCMGKCRYRITIRRALRRLGRTRAVRKTSESNINAGWASAHSAFELDHR